MIGREEGSLVGKTASALERSSSATKPRRARIDRTPPVVFATKLLGIIPSPACWTVARWRCLSAAVCLPRLLAGGISKFRRFLTTGRNPFAWPTSWVVLGVRRQIRKRLADDSRSAVSRTTNSMHYSIATIVHAASQVATCIADFILFLLIIISVLDSCWFLTTPRCRMLRSQLLPPSPVTSS